MERMVRTEYFQTGTVVECLESEDKFNAIRELLKKAPVVAAFKDACLIEEAAIEREKVYTTGIGRGVAIAHGKTPCVADTIILLGISKKGIDFQSADGQLVHLLFLIANPPDKSEEYLLALSTLARLMRQNDFTASLYETLSACQVERLMCDQFKALLQDRADN
ncbi:MAG: PTS sugar transporter subunit IIA [Spirochaetales bacterium]|nr:PTS sugar transporter subunit IIA [Spirochaetales bacterium]